MPVGVIVGPTDHITTIFRGQWAWVGSNIADYGGLNGRGCVHVGVLLIELVLIALVVGAFWINSKRPSTTS